VAAPESTRRLALITGASSGIGEAFARAYAARGYDLAITARRQDRLQALAAELDARHGAGVLVIAADLAGWEAHLPILEAIEAAGRHVDVLVNNAGFGVAQTFVGVPWERQRDFLMTLVVNACALAHAVIPGMVERRWGRIVNVASLAAFSPGAAGHSLYPGAKSLMVKFSQSLDAELKDKGIKVTALCPGFTRTGFAEAEGTQHLMDQAPRTFWQTAEEVVQAAIAANERGKVVEVPGWHNKLAATLLQVLPDSLLGPLIDRGAAKYRLED
jgi:short-subunit dehydrogenase